ncbi:MAG: glycosyltransferase [Acidobacteria bacterium]|nr:MAG: glycosyltransferase [Acidobacteriota bacterium]
MKVHVWMPDYVSAMGGIQALSRFLVRALRECLPDAEIVVFTKNDRSVPDPEENTVTRFSTVGWWAPSQRTAAFTVELLRCAVRQRPDLIITTHVNFTPIAHWLKKSFKIPFIALGHGVEVWQIQSIRVRRALRSADRLLAVSEFTRKRMANALSISSNAIEMLPNTFDMQKFELGPKPHFLLKRYGLRHDQPVILTVARLSSVEQYKGYDQVLRALPAVKRVLPDVRYILGGRGPDRSRVLQLISELGVTDSVILAGYIPDYELSSFYNLCDVFAMPSRGEGFGIVFLEALACGKPVIAGNTDGSVDAALNGRLGVLVDPGNVDEISMALMQVLSKRRPLQILKQPDALRSGVINAYGYKRFVERVREIIQPFVD